MAEIEVPSLSHQGSFDLKIVSSSTVQSHDSVMNKLIKSFDKEDEIPTVDYSLLFSDDPVQKAAALQHLTIACEKYGFFYLVNGVPESVVEWALKGSSDFFDLTEEEERRQYSKKNSADRIRWGMRSNSGENREHLKLIAHPQCQYPQKATNFRETVGEYLKSFREVEVGLARAISKILGFEETYIEKAFKLEEGFDVAALNLYPPSSQSVGSVGLADHTDPGLFVSLIQDVDGGFQILTNTGKWIEVHIPRNAILINIGDHLEILSNGKYKSHFHHVIVGNNKVRRISLATLHGPSLDAVVAPAVELVDESHPPAYRGLTYKECLEMNGNDLIDVQSCLAELRF